ncbi:MAG: hypothetical protein HY959_03750 [Ignavibacteriae bacterium]|nr:hypothetical protein [Ignavibacteriota bacterium]
MSEEKDKSIENEEEENSELDVDEGSEEEEEESESEEDDKSEDEDKSKGKSKEEGDKSLKSDKKDIKDHNRKGYEKRHSKDGVSREEHEHTVSRLDKIEEENKDLKFRQVHPELTDDIFNSLKALCKGSGIEYDEGLKNPVIQIAIDTAKSKERVDGASSTNPSTKSKSSGASGSPNWSEIPAGSKEFEDERARILSERRA